MEFTTDLWKFCAKGLEYLFHLFKVGMVNIVTRVLAAFGLSIVTVNTLFPALRGWLEGYMTSLPSNVLDFMGAIGLDIFMGAVISALVVESTTRIFLMPTAAVDAIRGAQQ